MPSLESLFMDFSTVDPGYPTFPTEWTVRQAAVTSLIWFCATIPWLLLCAATYRGALRTWALKTAVLCSITSALGWEIWFTYGLVDGQPVDERRPEPLNRAMPRDINWILNSLDDGTICMVGMAITWLVSREDGLRRVRWQAALLCSLWFLLQNIAVEMVIYSGQLAEGTEISWAPMAPTGPYWNPALFRIGDSRCSLQAQLPWLFMIPIFFGILNWQYRREEAAAREEKWRLV